MGPLLKFFALTYAVTWTCFIGAVEISHGTAQAGPARAAVRGALLLLGTFAPALVALAITARDDGMPAAEALFRRVFQWKASARWYFFAISYMAAIKLAVAVTHHAITGSWPRFGTEAWYIIVVAIVISIPVQAGEEIGWRGYTLPRLAGRFGYGGGGVLLGLIWACWHLPLFFLPGADKYGQSFPIWVLGVTALSVAITWLYAHVNGSLLLTMLMHSAVNQTIGIIPDGTPNAANPFALSASLPYLLTALNGSNGWCRARLAEARRRIHWTNVSINPEALVGRCGRESY
ncbi:MAG: CPBP family intramembrane glutamic endopeptidase [Candidatus Acidiferrales bacterium]